MRSPVLPVVVEPNADLDRIPYGASVGLKTLAPGRYVLKVTVTDRTTQTPARPVKSSSMSSDLLLL